MGRGSTKATVTRFPPHLSIWRRGLTQSFNSLAEAFEAVCVFLHAESKPQQSHKISYYFMSFVQRKSKISIQKNPSEHPQKCRGWYVWAQMQRPSKTEEQSPKFKIFNAIGNRRSYRKRQANVGKQTGREQGKIQKQTTNQSYMGVKQEVTRES